MKLDRLRHVARKPPRYLIRRVGDELRQEAQRGELFLALKGRGPVARGVPPADRARALALTRSRSVSLGAWQLAADAVRKDDIRRARQAERAEAARARLIDVFGEAAVFAGIPPRWNTDIRSGHDWPHGFHRGIDYRNIDRASDVKVAWELSRLRHLVALAQDVAVTENADSLAVIEQDLASWIGGNPVGWSVNWASAMEVALRAVNLICIDGILSAHNVRYETRPLLVRSLYQHGWFLSRNLEISDINGNHYLADAVGLVWLGRYFGEIGEAPTWAATGRDMVRSAARDQILDDGLDHEGSLPYHLLVLEMFLVAIHADRAGLEDTVPRVHSMVAAAAPWVAGGAVVPDIGDDDGGRVLALSSDRSADVRRVLSLAHSVIGSGVPALELPDDALWLCGPRGDRAPLSTPVSPGPLLFRSGGIAVLGTGEDRVTVDVGPIGFRGRGGHGHLDAMSFEAVLGGKVAVRDSGTGSYTGDPQTRNRLRDLNAHTVALVDGMPFAELGNTAALWVISGDAPPVVETCEAVGESHRLRVAQTLPARGGEACHVREVRWEPGELHWSDTITAPSGATIELFVQLPAGTVGSGWILENPDFRYRIEPPVDAQLTLLEVPWSPAYGALATACRAVVRYTVDGNPTTTHWHVQRR